jgi:hypothetical protein
MHFIRFCLSLSVVFFLAQNAFAQRGERVTFELRKLHLGRPGPVIGAKDFPRGKSVRCVKESFDLRPGAGLAVGRIACFKGLRKIADQGESFIAQ